VALKMMLAGALADGPERQRFCREAQIVAGLNHPNLVPLYGFGEHDGRLYLSLEFCPGGTLADRLVTGPLQPRVAAELVQCLTEAVHVAHKAGITHRDLKPANILFDRDGAPKITDFGLARRTADASLTDPGKLVGTPAYMAPEQVRGEEAGSATDIWALGVMLYECLTGRVPFDAANVLDRFDRIKADEPIPPARMNSSVPRDLETICLKCLHKEPGRRYASAKDLADDLRRFLGGEPIQARPIGVIEWAWKWSLRNPWKAIGSGLALVLLIVAIAGGFVVQHLRAEARAETRAKAAAELAAEKEHLLQRLTLAAFQWYKGEKEDAKETFAWAHETIDELAERHPNDAGCLYLLGYRHVVAAEMVEGSEQVYKDRLSWGVRATLATLGGKDPLPANLRRTLEEMLSCYTDAVAAFRQVRYDGDSHLKKIVLAQLGHTQAKRGDAFAWLMRYSEAVEAYGECLVYDLYLSKRRRDAIAAQHGANLTSAVWEQRNLPWSRGEKADHAKAVRLSAYLAQCEGVPDSAIYNAACAHSLASAEQGISAEERDRRAAQAVAFLQKIEQDGYFRDPQKRKELREDEDLNALRHRTDFQGLLRLVPKE
jgi:tetratricopeptide (TPR) repeat protein